LAWHDDLAATARRKGKRSEQFHATAQRYADSSWWWLITIGVVWYFFGWLWSLIPAGLLLGAIIQSVSSTMVATRLERYETSDGDREAT